MKTVRPLQGTTIIELLSCLVIIAVLSAMLYPTFSSAMLEAKATSSKLNVRNQWVHLKLYQSDNGDEVGSFESWEKENYPDAGTLLSNLGFLPKERNRQSPCGVLPNWFLSGDAVEYMHQHISDDSKNGYDGWSNAADLKAFKAKAIMVADIQCNKSVADPKKQYWKKRSIGVDESGALRVITDDQWQHWQSFFWRLKRVESQ